MPDDIRSLRLSMSVDGNQVVKESISELAVATEGGTARIVRSLQTGDVAMRHHAGEATEARHALHGLGEEVGVHMPRFIQSYISGLEGVAPVMAEAFSAIAILGIIQLVATELPEAFERLKGAITGWSKQAQKDYDDFIKKNVEAEAAARHFAVTMASIGKGAPMGAALKLQDARDHVAQLGREVAGANKEVEELVARIKAGDKTGVTDYRAGMDIGEAVKRRDALKKLLEEATTQEKEVEREAATTVEEDKVSKAEAAAKKKEAADKKAADESIALGNQVWHAAVADAIKEGEEKERIHQKELEDYKKAQEESIALGNEVFRQAVDDAMREGEAKERQHQKDLEDYRREKEEEIRLGDEVYRQAVQDAIKEGEAQERIHQKELEDYVRTQEEIARAHKQMTDRVEQAFASHVTALIAGQETLSDALKNSWNSMASTFITNLVKMGEQALIAAALHKTIAAKAIYVDAKKAAADTWQALSGIPIVGPVIAPIAAAGAFAGVMALASFDKGGIMDENNMAMLHKKEMVLDPALSTFVQNAARNAGSNAGSGGGGGAHLTYAPTIYGGDPGALKDILRQHKDEIFQIVRNGVRHGNLKFGGM